MQASQRILTTHTGSFPRLPSILPFLIKKVDRKAVDEAEFEAACTRAVEEIVARQCDVGLDIINDGEQSKTGFVQYTRDRLTGFDGTLEKRPVSLDGRDFPDAYKPEPLAACTGPISWKDFGAVEKDIANLKAATKKYPGKRYFMNAVSPGSFSNNNPNKYYKTREAYLAAIVDAMAREYEAIAAAGFTVQIDSPDLALHSVFFPDLPLKEWRKIVEENIAALNQAAKSIPREQIRVHVCWGASEGPHTHDVELNEILDTLLTIRASAISIVGANARHEHEWRHWQNVELPAGLTIIPGVIDSTTNIVEHPQVVADRLVRYASILGRDRIIAGVDCGFGTNGVRQPAVFPSVVWAKLRALTEGARLASESLWK